GALSHSAREPDLGRAGSNAEPRCVIVVAPVTHRTTIPYALRTSERPAVARPLCGSFLLYVTPPYHPSATATGLGPPREWWDAVAVQRSCWTATATVTSYLA